MRQFVERGKLMYCGSRPLQGWIVCDRVGLPDPPPAIVGPPPAIVDPPPVVGEPAPVVGEPAPTPEPAATQSTGVEPTVVVAGGAVAAAAIAPWLPWWAGVAMVIAAMVGLIVLAWPRSASRD